MPLNEEQDLRTAASGLGKLGQSLADAARPQLELPSFADVAPGQLSEEEWEKIKPHLEKNIPIEKDVGAEGAASFVRGLIGIPESAARFGGFMAGDVLGLKPVKEHVTQPIVEALESIKESPVLRTSTAVEGDLEEHPEMLADPRWWASRLPEAATSMIPALGGGILGRVVGMARHGGKLKAAIDAGDNAGAEAIAKTIQKFSTAGTFGASMAMETAEAAQRMDQFQKETGQPLSWGTKVIAGLGTGIIAGGMEAFAIEKIFGGLAGESLVKKIVQGVLTEGGTEGAQSLVENAFQKLGYDPSQRLTEGVLESIIIGAAIGGIAGAGAKGYERLTKRPVLGFKLPEATITPDELLERPEFATMRTGAGAAMGETLGEARRPLDIQREPIGLFRTGEESWQRPPEEPEAGEAPAILDQAGRPARESLAQQERQQEIEAALAKEPFQRDATEKFLVDTLAQPGAIAPPAAGEVRPEERHPSPAGPMAPASADIEEIGSPGVPEPPSLRERVSQLTAMVEETGDPAASQELTQLITANRKEVSDLFRAPENEALRPIADRLDTLVRRVEEGDPNAASELHQLMAANQEALRGATYGDMVRPRPEPITPAGAYFEAIETPEPTPPTPPAPTEVPDLQGRLAQLVSVVNETGEPAAAQELTDLIISNREAVADLFRMPEREGLRPLAERLEALISQVERTGDPNAARALHEFLTANIDTLRGVSRGEIRNVAGIETMPPEVLPTPSGEAQSPGVPPMPPGTPPGPPGAPTPTPGIPPTTLTPPPEAPPSPGAPPAAGAPPVDVEATWQKDLERTGTAMTEGASVKIVRHPSGEGYGVEVILEGDRQLWDGAKKYDDLFEAREAATNVLYDWKVGALKGFPEWAIPPGAYPAAPAAPMSDEELVREAKKELQEAKVVATGKEDVAITAAGEDVPTTFALAEADDLIVSHDDNFEETPEYPQELQPRERDRPAYQKQVSDIANKLDPRRLTINPMTSDGAPIIGPDMLVESGNGRVMAIKRAYGDVPTKIASGQANVYKQYLVDHAADFGIDPDAIRKTKHPVLVRVRSIPEGETIEQRAQLAREMNKRSTAPMAAVEQAQADAKAMIDKDILKLFVPNEDGEVGKAENLPFIRRFLSDVVGDPEMNELIDKDGLLNQKGILRIRNAIFAAAYGDTAALEKLAESLNDSARNITAALTQVAPRMALLQNEVKAGSRYDLGLNEQLAQAATILQSLRVQGVGIDEFLAQGNLLGKVDPLVADILKFFGDYGRSRKKIGATLNAYLDIVEEAGDPRQKNLLGTGAKVPTREEALQAAIGGMEETNGQGTAVSPDLQQGQAGSGEGVEKAAPAAQGKAGTEEKPKGAGGIPGITPPPTQDLTVADIEAEIAKKEDNYAKRLARGEVSPKLKEEIESLKGQLAKLKAAEKPAPEKPVGAIPGLTPPKVTPKPQSATDVKVAEVLKMVPGINEDKVRTVFRALPNASPQEAAFMAQDDELFNAVAKGNLSALEKEHLYRKYRESQGQGNLPGMGGGGGLFDIEPEPKAAPPPAPEWRESGRFPTEESAKQALDRLKAHPGQVGKREYRIRALKSGTWLLESAPPAPAPPKAPPEAPGEAAFMDILLFAADSPGELRPPDVDRVMSEAADRGIVEEFRTWLLLKTDLKDRTREAVDSWKSEAAPEAPPGWQIDKVQDGIMASNAALGIRKVMSGEFADAVDWIKKYESGGLPKFTYELKQEYNAYKKRNLWSLKLFNEEGQKTIDESHETKEHALKEIENRRRGLDYTLSEREAITEPEAKAPETTHALEDFYGDWEHVADFDSWADARRKAKNLYSSKVGKTYAIDTRQKDGRWWVVRKKLAGETKPDAPEAEADAATQQETTASQGIANQVKDWLQKGLKGRGFAGPGQLSSLPNFHLRQLFAWADDAFGGTQAEGKYTPKDAYDAMELGVNQFIQDNPQLFDPHSNDPAKVVERLENITKLLPTQTRRTEESQEFQQFSTPPALAYVVGWVANIGQNDVLLEPEAGTGSLAIAGTTAGADTIIVNELSPRRAALLKELGFDLVTTENAEQLSNILPGILKKNNVPGPTVVVMNPPFSATAGRLGDKKVIQTGANHIEQALKLLPEGGRLVAIVGRGMAFGKPAFVDWWGKIRKEYNVLANIGISGKNYTKYGTSFDNQIVVIDKTGPTPGAVVIGAVENLSDLFSKLEEVRNARVPAAKREPGKPGGQEGAPPSQPKTGHPGPAHPPTHGVGAGQEEGGPPSPAAGGAGTGDTVPGAPVQPGPGRPGPPVRDTTERPGGAVGTAEAGAEEGTPVGGESGAGGVGATGGLDGRQPDVGGQPKTGGQRDVSGPRIQTQEKEEATGEFTDSVFEDYTPALKVSGAKPHPATLKESAAMSTVKLPAATYTPNLPQHILTEGRLSDIQMEAVVYAGQAHEQMLPSGERRGFALGDGTGVGKAREVGAIFWDNFNQGRKKGVWLSYGPHLIKDAKEQTELMGWDPGILRPMPKAGATIKDKEGVLFVSYDTLRGGEVASSVPGQTPKSRVDQIVEWLGEDFDGVIAYDEAHSMNNARGDRTQGGGLGAGIKASKKALAGVELQRRLPNARVVYASATIGEAVDHLAFADRLGMWGPGTEFANRNEFLNQIEAGGVAAMEVVAKDMKALGRYVARSLSYDNVTYERITHELTPEQTEVYDELAEAWQVMNESVDQAMGDTGADTHTIRRNKALFWGYNLRFFNQVTTAMQMPSVLAAMERDLANGDSPIVQLVNTYGDAQDKKIAKMAEGMEFDELDFTPREMIISYLNKYFPTQQFEEYVDENGDTHTRPVRDAEGNLVHNAKALAAKQQMIENLGLLKFPENPLDQIINRFGPDVVAEVTGRKQRVYKGKLQKRGNAAVQNDIKAYKDDTKRVLVFSGKGDTGASYHADLGIKNQRKRRHYVVQPGWQAKKAVQGTGRSHRTNQAQDPTYILCETNVKGQRRFTSAIARKLDQLGALTKGQRQTASTGLLKAEDNLMTVHGQSAVERFIDDLRAGTVDGLTAQEYVRQTGWKLTYTDSSGNVRVNYPETKQFFNRLLSMKVAKQNIAFDHFDAAHKDILRRAAEHGTLDVGMETLKAAPGGRIEKVSEQTVYVDPETKAESKVVTFDKTEPTQPREFADAASGYQMNSDMQFAVNVKSGQIWSVDARNMKDVTDKKGRVKQQCRAYGPNKISRRWVDTEAFGDADKWTRFPLTAAGRDQAKIAWNKAVNALPQETSERLHLVTGLLLPIWKRLKGGTRVYRLQDEAGKRYVGRLIEEEHLDETLTKLGATPEVQAVKVKTGRDIFEKVYDSNWVVTLANGWEFRRAVVSNDTRVELVGPAKEHMPELRDIGLIVETHNFKTRIFVPIRLVGGRETVEHSTYELFNKIIKNRPVIEAKPRFSGSSGRQFRLGGLAPARAEAITTEKIKQRLGGVEVQEFEDGGGWGIKLPSGKVMAIQLNQKLGKPSFEELERTYKGLTRKEYESGEVTGEWRPMSVGGSVALAKGATMVVVDHELLHGAADLVLTQAEIDQLLKDHGDWEAAAEAYEKWQPREAHTLFQKIYNFFRRLMHMLRPNTSEAIFERIRSGQVWMRKEVGPGAWQARQSFSPKKEAGPPATTTQQSQADRAQKRRERGQPGQVIDVRYSFRTSPVEAAAEQRLTGYEEKMMAQEAKKKPFVVRLRQSFSKESWHEKASRFRDLYDEIVDRMAPFEREEAKMVAEHGITLAKGEAATYTVGFWRGQEGWVANAIMKNGVYHEIMSEGGEFIGDAKKVGESLSKRHDPLRKLAKKRNEDPDKVINDLYNRYMVAQRDLELAGETGVREPGEIKGTKPEASRQALKDLKELYGEDFKILEEVAGRMEENGNFTKESIREWSDQAILQRLLMAGIIDRARYEEIKSKNQYYVPFKRLMDEVDEYVNAYSQALGLKGRAIEKIKGSELAILNPLEMLMELAAKANYAYARNRILAGAARLGQLGDPDIKEVSAKFFPVDETLKQEVDVGLRKQLHTLADKLGVAIKVVKSLRGRRLGEFRSWLKQEVNDGDLTQEEAKEIAVRFATSERTLAHELGHALDKEHDLVSLLIHQGTPEMKRELRRIADQRADLCDSKSYKKYVRKRTEQVAEFVSRYINDRGTAKALAPNAVSEFEAFLRKNGLDDLIKFKPSHRLGVMEFQNKVWARSPLPPEPGTVPYFRGGKQRWLKLPPDMFKATQSMMPEDIGLFLSIAKMPADWLRAGSVTTPEFGLFTNPFRDIVQASIMSRFGFNPLLWFRDAYKVFSKDEATMEAYHKAEAMGGFMATMAQSFIDPAKITVDDITGKRKGLLYKAHPVQALRHVSAYLENMTRFSIYQQAIAKGLSPAEAIHEMRRTTLDFRRFGGHPVIRYLNMIIPFFNAGVQGTDKLLTELTGPNKWAVMRRMALLGAASIGLWLLAHDDDRYKELEDWERNYFWHIPLGGKDSPMLRLPKPFEAGILFGSVPERILDAMVDKNVGGLKSALGAAWESLTPDFIPAIARPFIEGKANYSWFLERPIEDVSLQKLPVEMRSKPWTSELAKAASRYIGPVVNPVYELSPVKVEHLIRTMTGGLGANYFLPGIDVALRKAGVLDDIPQPTRDTLQQIWGVRAFFTKPPTGYRAKTVNNFMENYQEILQADQGWKFLWNSGQMDRLDTFLQDRPEAMYARTARKFMAELGDIRKEREKIYLSRELTSDQKKEKLDALDEKIVSLAKVGQAFMDRGVAEAMKMPSRFKSEDGTRKSVDLDEYYKMTVESVGDAYDKVKKDLPRIANMDKDQRQGYISKALRQAREEYQPILKNPMDVLKPYRFSNLLDRPTRQERASWQQTMGFKKTTPGLITGFRLKEGEEAQ